MGKILLSIGHRIVISRRNRSVRQGFVYTLTNFLLVSGIVFIAEVILIFLGVGNIFLPWTNQFTDFLHNLVF